MKIAIVHDSRTGTTAAAAKAMAGILERRGHSCTLGPLAGADPSKISEADLVCVGSWTQGLFVILQHPTRASMEFISRLGDLHGKKAVVFCTYKLATGSLLPRMAAAMAARGATVVGQFRFRGPSVHEGFVSFASSLGDGA
ncbi:MAG: hypothetical protein HYY06_15995 [Deltaproteobacteria bacterium]|nr:hypothetical protein [Deltaproteobacteria bacterium]